MFLAECPVPMLCSRREKRGVKKISSLLKRPKKEEINIQIYNFHFLFPKQYNKLQLNSCALPLSVAHPGLIVFWYLWNPLYKTPSLPLSGPPHYSQRSLEWTCKLHLIKWVKAIETKSVEENWSGHDINYYYVKRKFPCFPIKPTFWISIENFVLRPFKYKLHCSWSMPLSVLPEKEARKTWGGHFGGA